MIDSISVLGLRGFAKAQTLRIAQPSGKPGSGMTIIVGANNSGKSTIIEALRAIAQPQAPSFTQGRRNQAAGDLVEITATDSKNNTIKLKSITTGGSETEFELKGEFNKTKLLVLPSRRMFNPYFGRSTTSRADYMANVGFPTTRTTLVDQFTLRLFAIQKNGAQFNSLLEKIVSPAPSWTIDQMDTGQHFLKIKKNDSTHSSEGLGEGLISLLYIVDALYDSQEGDVIVIDEPELSLHPALQRKLASVFLDHSSTRQIIIATHSPYFASLSALDNGGTLARVHLNGIGFSEISQITQQTALRLKGLRENQNNPHILGINAQEAFFVEDSVILVEGQEDVIFYDITLKDLGLSLPGHFYGWGVGGAENMKILAKLLEELGFAHVVGILDQNKKALEEELKREFPSYHFTSIPTDDVRSKKETKAKPAVSGLLDEANKVVRSEYRERTIAMFDEVAAFLKKPD